MAKSKISLVKKAAGAFRGITAFFSNIRIEARHVRWPSKKEAVKTTLFVLLTAIAGACLFGGVSWAMSALLEILL